MGDDAKKKPPMTDSQKLIAAVAQNQAKLRALTQKFENTEMDSGIDTVVLVSRLEKVEKQNKRLIGALILVGSLMIVFGVVTTGRVSKVEYGLSEEGFANLFVKIHNAERRFEASEAEDFMANRPVDPRVIYADAIVAKTVQIWRDGEMPAALGTTGTTEGAALYFYSPEKKNSALSSTGLMMYDANIGKTASDGGVAAIGHDGIAVEQLVLPSGVFR